MASRVDDALACFGEGFNCAQAALSPYAEAAGMDASTALKIASPFGGGLGRTGGLCGAVSGALMALGALRGTGSNDMADKGRDGELARDFMARFRRRNGSLICKDLLDCDIGTPEGWAEAQAKSFHTEVCPRFVGSAVEIVEEMLAE
jgi:C_GCAxxG_C_C family probable redox protein